MDNPLAVFVGFVVAAWIIVLSVFGMIKVGSNMFDMSSGTPGENYSSDERLNCSYRGGTVVAENGEYKECKLGETK